MIVSNGYSFNISVYVTTPAWFHHANVYLYDAEGTSLLPTVFFLHGNTDTTEAFNYSEIVTNVNNTDCFTFEVTSYTYFPYRIVDTTSYQLFVNDIELTVGAQAEIQEYELQYSYSTDLDFCLSMFDFEQTTNVSNKQINVIFDEYPQGLVLELESVTDTSVVYTNNLETTNDKAVNSNRSLLLTNIASDCYVLTLYDNDFNDMESSVTDHSLYKILLNSNSNETIVGYGGYFSTSESHTFCTSDNSYCIIPYECDGTALSGSEIAMSNPDSYKSYYGVILADKDVYTYVDELSISCNGKFSCQDSSFISTGGNLEAIYYCNGAYSCYNMTTQMQMYFQQIPFYCRGYKSCFDSIFRNSIGPDGTWSLFWYANPCLFFVVFTFFFKSVFVLICN